MIYICRGPAARTEEERALCLQALDDLEVSLNVRIWRSRILSIHAIQKLEKPNSRFGGNINGRYYTIPDMIEEWGLVGIIRAWDWWKNQRKGCKQNLDSVIRRMEDDNIFLQNMFGVELELGYYYQEYRICPKCGDKDPIALGRTNWER